MTIADVFLRRAVALRFERETVKTEDGGTLALAWAQPTKAAPPTAPTLVVLPG